MNIRISFGLWFPNLKCLWFVRQYFIRQDLDAARLVYKTELDHHNPKNGTRALRQAQGTIRQLEERLGWY